MEYMFLLLTGILWIFICRYYAEGKGRRVWLWTILGLLVGIVAVIAILVMPEVKYTDDSQPPSAS